MHTINLHETLYDEHFKKSYDFLKLSIKDDLVKEIETLTKTIDTLMTYQGNDWTGRGELLLIRTNATIAASEVLKGELEDALEAQQKRLLKA